LVKSSKVKFRACDVNAQAKRMWRGRRNKDDALTVRRSSDAAFVVRKGVSLVAFLAFVPSFVKMHGLGKTFVIVDARVDAFRPCQAAFRRI
jgi:hypothetical protein